ncbi:MAG: pilus assembly protein PilM [Candidatus Rokubacteria bacterium]|nr:pilus assembly protein PilM [Candidatus Rokubacteria bacterium]
MSDVIGLAIGDERLVCVVIRRRLGSARVLAAFKLSVGTEVGAALRAKLRELGVRARRAHVGIPRRRAVVKVIELPTVAGADLRRMVRFELERHLPFPPADAIFDFHVVDQAPGHPVRVLLVAVERRVFEWAHQVLHDAGLVPRLVDVTIHSLALLAARGAKAQPRAGRVVLHLEEAEAELAVVRDGRLILSRAFPLPQDAKERGHVLAEELRRSLGTLRVEDRERVADVLVTGGEGLPGTRWTELPVDSEVPLPDRLRGVPDDSSFVPALAVALRRPLRGALPTNLMPDELRPRPFPWPVAVAATLAALALLLALTIPALTLIRDERRLRALDRALAELAPEVREVEKLASAVERARREAETLRSFQAQHVRALPLLRELTELLPQDVWLTNFSVDRKGIELAGFANSASQLIPLLEASPTLERVEFISPVTKGRDREQFRLKAGWERPPGRPPTQSGAPPRAEASREPAPPSSTGAPRPAPLPGSR